MEKNTISLIVPIYKVPEDLLRKCIESLIGQTYKNIEIVLVDDGSPDGCGNICDEYAKKDNRIVVVHQKNRGLSGARNAGYDIASGDWITLVDGDDWIEKETCEILSKYIKEDIDIICFGVIKDYGEKKHYYKYNDKYIHEKIYENEEVKYMQYNLLDYNGNNAWAYAKLINKKFIDKYSIKYDEKLRQGAEALEFNLRLFEKAKKIQFIKEYLYHYMYNDNSITAKHNVENHKYVIKCFERIKEFIEKSNNKEKLMKMFYNRLLYVIVTTAISGYFNPNNNETYKMKKKGYKEYLQNKLIQETLKKAEWKGIGLQRKIIIIFIKCKFFIGIDFLAKIRKKQKLLRMKK